MTNAVEETVIDSFEDEGGKLVFVETRLPGGVMMELQVIERGKKHPRTLSHMYQRDGGETL